MHLEQQPPVAVLVLWYWFGIGGLGSVLVEYWSIGGLGSVKGENCCDRSGILRAAAPAKLSMKWTNQPFCRHQI